MEENIEDLLNTIGFNLLKINQLPLAQSVIEQYKEGIISRGQLINMLRKIERKFKVNLSL